MPVRLIAAAGACAGACILFAFIFGYHQGAEKIKRDMAIQAAAQAEDARQKEKDMQKRLNGITENYLHEIEEYKKTISAYAANDLDVNRLSDTRPCQSVPGDTADRSGAVCYTPADIQKKIKESLDIAAECDELAIKYNALLKSYQGIYKHDDN